MVLTAAVFQVFTMKCLSAFALLVASLMPISAAAQTDWPRKPVQIVVPYGAGGAVDVMIRIFAEHMS
jgi:tripartite-type tricarboxylate transporter receptor subunit TctC